MLAVAVNSDPFQTFQREIMEGVRGGGGGGGGAEDCSASAVPHCGQQRDGDKNSCCRKALTEAA